MQSNFRYIFFGIIILAAFILGTQTCNNIPKNDLKPITDTLVIHKSDTLRDTTTIFKFKEKPVFRYIVLNEEIDSLKYKEVYKKRAYHDIYRDSNQVVTIDDTIIGYLLGRKVDYQLFVPLRIYDTTRMTITKQIPIVKKPNFQFGVGILANRTNIYGMIDINIKRVTYTIGYDPFNKREIVGLKYTLFSR